MQQINFTNPHLQNQQPANPNIQFKLNPPQPVFLTPQKQPTNIPNHPHLHQQQSQRIMYKSTIQPLNNASNQQFTGSLGLGKLQTMGRVIHEIDDQPHKLAQKTTVIQHMPAKPLAFRSDRPEKQKMVSSMIFFNNKGMQQTPNFPSFTNVALQKNEPQKGIQSLISKAKVVSQEVELPQTAQNRRNQQIFEIKQQMNHLSQRLEGCRPKNTPVFLPPKPPQPVTHLQFVNNTKNNPNTISSASSSNPNNRHNQENNYNIVVTANPPQKNGTTMKSADNHESNDLIKKMSTLSTSTSASTQGQRFSIKQQTTMFKKKSPYVTSQSQKTDQKLLKMLGIHIKPSNSRQFVATPQKQQNLCSKSSQLIPKTQMSLNPNKILQQFNHIKNNNEVTPARKITKNDFIIGKKMGKGQFGEVMLVQHKITGFICGMKVMSKKQIKSEKYQNQIARELSIQFYLSHRNIAPLYGYFQDQENLYLLVQFCTDGQLLDMIRKNRRMEQHEVSPIIRQICQGLDYIHKEEIIHRDVKPQNILFNFGTVKISDFGWAVHSGNGMRKTVSGSPLYYSPQIVLQTEYDEKIDIWSIGMMAYECLLGKIPFRIYSQFDLNRIVEDDINFPEYVDVTDEAKDFILGIMKKKPQERMEMKQIMRHPFITKYLKQRKVAPQILQQFRKILSL